MGTLVKPRWLVSLPKKKPTNTHPIARKRCSIWEIYTLDTGNAVSSETLPSGKSYALHLMHILYRVLYMTNGMITTTHYHHQLTI